RYANACGAFAVSRHACAPSYPSEEEMQTFIAHGSDHFRLREDEALNQLHWSTTRQGELPEVLAFAFDHRSQLEALCDDPAKIGDFKRLCAEVTAEAVARQPDRQLGALCDHRLGQEALFDMAEGGLWLAAPIELPGSRPLRFEGGPSLAGTLRAWPKGQVVKCLCYTHPDDGDAMWQEQRATLLELFTATRELGLELLLEFIPPADMPKDTTTLARSMTQAYEAGIFPDWWKLPAPEADNWEAEWDAWNKVIETHDPHCRGVLLLGLAAPRADVRASIARASEQPLCKGFAVGRTIFGEAAEAWFAGRVDDAGAKALMSAALDDLIAAWSAS
ncbi:MAG TPA: 5-dehydro-2-deoxygluconokinase, partial [Alphaproteobacteria bacterium]|nr:5-dehydro-2-deoxygluconokinase [Alphaproteobacteria bacterium]